MSWGNPWAWAGIVTIALPVLIHLLGRGHARVQRFPSLRFLEASRLLPTRRTRVHDLVLLAIRAGILAAGVAALAQPTLRTDDRARALGRSLARAIVLDTSISMQRATPVGERAVDAGRREARRVASDAQTSTLLETRAPARAIAAAIEWLNTQPGRGELVIVSDFQSGSLNATDLAVLARETGVRLVRIPVGQPVAATDIVARSGRGETVARTTLSPERTDVEWSTRAGSASQAGEVRILAGPDERARADAAVRAAATVAVRSPLDSTHVVAIVYPQFAQRTELMRSSSAIHTRWATDLVARLGSDSMLITRQDSSEGRDRLLLFSSADAGSLTSAALIAAVTQARSMASPLAELEPSLLSDETLTSWQRAPAADAPARNNGNANPGTSDGRWFWVLALALLALETWMRRAVPGLGANRLTADARDRAA